MVQSELVNLIATKTYWNCKQTGDWQGGIGDVLVLSFRNLKPASICRAHLDSLDGMASTNCSIQVLFSNCYEIQILIQFSRSLKNSIIQVVCFNLWDWITGDWSYLDSPWNLKECRCEFVGGFVSGTPTCAGRFSPFSQNHQGQFLQDFRKLLLLSPSLWCCNKKKEVTAATLSSPFLLHYPNKRKVMIFFVTLQQTKRQWPSSLHCNKKRRW